MKKYTDKELKKWADVNGYNVIKIKGDMALVDKVPSQWFAPQWVKIKIEK